jgi:hypothetical protein
MAETRFSAKQWELDRAQDWAAWLESPESSRIERMSRLAEGVRRLTMRWAASPEQAEHVVSELPRTLGKCNELAFSSSPETLAYTIWHLVDRYARILQVLRTREVGALASPKDAVVGFGDRCRPFTGTPRS